MKIQKNRENKMSETEKEATKELPKETSEKEVQDNNQSLVQNAFKKRRKL